MPAAPTVFVVDDDSAVRDSLSALLETNGLCCEVFGSAEDYLARFHSDPPGCMLLDLRMPGIDGMELQRRLRKRGGTLPIIVLTAHGDVPTAVKTLKNGAFDFVQKPFQPVELLKKVGQALEADSRSRRRTHQERRFKDRLSTLSVRERQVLELIVAGCSTKEIAARLGTSYHTVSHQRTSVMKKLGVDSAAKLVRLFTQFQFDPGHSSQ